MEGAAVVAGVDCVVILCVNDGYVMQGWKQSRGLAGSELIVFLADPFGKLTSALGLNLPEPDAELGPLLRGQRAAMLVIDGVVRHMEISDPNGDPSGDHSKLNTSAPHMLEVAKGLK
jgi:peroxiredoxin